MTRLTAPGLVAGDPAARHAQSPVPAYLAGFVALGMAASFGGPALEHLRDVGGVGIGASGLFLGGQSLGYIVSSLLAGRAYDMGSGHRFWAAAALVAAGAAAALMIADRFVVIIALFVVIGVGTAVVDVGGNTLVVWAREGRTVASTLNALHLCFGIGALTTPLLVSRSVGWGGDLGWFALVLGVMTLVVCWLLLTSQQPPTRRPAPVVEESGPVRRRGLWLVCVFFFTYVGVEVGFAGSIHTYAVEIGLGGATTAGVLTSVFWVGFTLGRLSSIWLSRAFSAVTMLVGSCTAAALAATFLAIADGAAWAVWSSTALFGFAVAPQFPMMIAYADERLRLSGRSTSLFVASAGMGSLVLPVGIGWLFDWQGAAAMPWTVAIGCVVILAVLAALLSAAR